MAMRPLYYITLYFLFLLLHIAIIIVDSLRLTHRLLMRFVSFWFSSSGAICARALSPSSSLALPPRFVPLRYALMHVAFTLCSFQVRFGRVPLLLRLLLLPAFVD